MPDELRTFEVSGTELVNGSHVPVKLLLAEHPDSTIHLIGSSSRPDYDFGLPGDSRNPARLMPCPPMIDSFYMLPLFKKQRDALSRLIDYCWDDEKAEYRSHQTDSYHIFRDLVILHNAMAGLDLTEEDYLKPVQR